MQASRRDEGEWVYPNCIKHSVGLPDGLFAHAQINPICFPSARHARYTQAGEKLLIGGGFLGAIFSHFLCR